MVQAVMKDEARSRQHDSIFAEREAELDAVASKMPKSVGEFPYLMEINSGVIHPWTRSMSERSDLVVGCYNLDGSQNPEDADPSYNPNRPAIRGDKIRQRVKQVAPKTAAEQKAYEAGIEGRLRREMEAKLDEEREKIRREVIAELEAKITDSKQNTKGKKKQKETKEKQQEEVVQQEPAADLNIVDGRLVEDESFNTQNITEVFDTDLNAAFEEAMK